MKKCFALLIALMLFASFAMAETGLTNFVTYDINPANADIRAVSQDIFAGYDVTMVNIWATWCGYCIKGMPELAKLKDMLPENVNLITICDDATTEPQLAQEILKITGATNFPTLMASADMYDQLLGQIYSFPTTYFLDSTGMPITQPVIGVPSLSDTAEIYLAMINEVLAMVEAEA